MSTTPFRNFGDRDPLFGTFLPLSRRILDTMDSPASEDSPVFSFANIKVDWKETSDAHLFTADLPGLNKEEVKIELVDEQTLRISGERMKEETENNDVWHRVERSSGRFMRQFRLPDNVKPDQISARLKNGLLS
ncbi:hypothetical protein KI387_009062, partial [Taxus chinensis]